MDGGATADVEPLASCSLVASPWPLDCGEARERVLHSSGLPKHGAPLRSILPLAKLDEQLFLLVDGDAAAASRAGAGAGAPLGTRIARSSVEGRHQRPR